MCGALSGRLCRAILFCVADGLLDRSGEQRGGCADPQEGVAGGLESDGVGTGPDFLAGIVGGFFDLSQGFGVVLVFRIPAAAQIGGQVVRSEAEGGYERVIGERLGIVSADLGFDLRDDDEVFFEFGLPGFVLVIVEPVVAHASGPTSASRRHLDGVLDFVELFGRLDAGQEQAAGAHVDRSSNDGGFARNGAHQDGEIRQPTHLANVADQFVREVAMLTIDDKIVQPAALADFDQKRPRLIGGHQADDQFVGAEFCIQFCRRFQHAFTISELSDQAGC